MFLRINYIQVFSVELTKWKTRGVKLKNNDDIKNKYKLNLSLTTLIEALMTTF